MIINNNIGAANTYRQLSINNASQSKNMEKLSSGMRINRGADDAAGLSISEKMRAQIRGLEQASKNAQDGISMIQTADGALNESHAILQRMRELTVQAANDTNSDDERTAISGELTQLTDTLTDISTNTQFNGQKILAGTAGSAGDGVVTLQTGANNGETFEINFNDTNSVDLSAILTTLGGPTVADSTEAATYLTALDTAIQSVSTGRAYLGAAQNALEYTTNNLNSSAQNTQAAESRVRDVDMAKEIVDQTKNSILAQAAQAMLSQANQQPQAVLQLLR
ncbi:flagellin [Neobacillus niacini]|uniref:flagellin N-terminal helical domain-containing protein n=1 Tax=Neobacillus niacini TaxID=86668 RepID=UPI00203CE263|nr:flagellin [Neobacillus niacini]MCM3693264.1 flagellin [Neobacillus niacini]